MLIWPAEREEAPVGPKSVNTHPLEPKSTMSDTPPEPTGDTPEPAPSKRTRSSINQKHAAELALAEAILGSAENTDYAPKLVDEGIDADFVAKLHSKIEEADKLLASAGSKTADKRTSTRSEETLKTKLLRRVSTIQTRAKRKYKTLGDPMRAKYYIGEPIGDSRSLLESAAKAILVHLKTDTLPGGKPTEVTALQTALSDYIRGQTAQTGDQSEATTARFLLAGKVKEIVDLRRDVQYAVDTLWPSDDPTNAGVRVQFKVPANRPLN